MDYLFDLCCGEGEEALKLGGFVAVDEWNPEVGEDTVMQRHASSREKAAVALELKHGASIFSSPIDHTAKLNINAFPKSVDEEEFLKATMKSHMLFEELSESELQTLVDGTEKVQIVKGERVAVQRDNGEYLFIVQHGKLDLYCEVQGKSCGKVEEGDVVGELALLYGQNYPLSVVASAPENTLWRMDHTTFRHVLAHHAHAQDNDILACLRNAELLSGLSPVQLQKFAHTLTRVHFEAGDRIVTKGEIGEIFYIIEKGSVKVHDIGMGDSQAVDQILKAGDSFGERALLTGEPRAASVTALTPVTTFAMDRVTFEKSLGGLGELMEVKAKIQSLKSLPIFANSDLTEVELERLAELTTEVCYMKGTKLCEAGKPYPLNLWFLRKGQLLVYGGKSEQIFNLRTGDYFGEKSILGDPKHISTHDATCEENVTAWLLQREDIESVIVDLNRLGASSSFVKTKPQTAIRGLGDLKKHRVLGQGGFGKVWLVETSVGSRPQALKVINKRKLLQSKQERSVLREKELLGVLRHPFILDMVASFQDATNLYLVLPLIQGGELFNVITSRSKGGLGIPNNEAAFYAGGVIEALGHFHHRYIAYRDLKLENVMIDAAGYVKIVDLGFAKVIVSKSFTFCGTPDYLAPEIIMSKGHNHAVDYWAFGVLLFEMLAGRSPFSKFNSDQMAMFKRIVLMNYDMPDKLHDSAKDLIGKLLVRKIPERLGMSSRGHFDVRDHPWFVESGCDYKLLLKKELTPPWIPEVHDPFDASNFNDMTAVEKDDPPGMPLSKAEHNVFAGF